MLDRWREVLGPDHPDTLAAASILTGVLDVLVDAEPARALGEDTLQRDRQAPGPDHPITLHPAQVAVTDHSLFGDDAAENDTSPRLRPRMNGHLLLWEKCW